MLRWMTANIGLHHVHHLSSRIPYYRLPQVLRDHPELQEAKSLTLVQSFACVRLTLWDEVRQRLVSFGEMRKTLINEDSEIGSNCGATGYLEQLSMSAASFGNGARHIALSQQSVTMEQTQCPESHSCQFR
jgi:hypothetical protein